jgi:membrane protease YdiL (CAAX protease family)
VSFARRYPVASYYVLTFAISWAGALCVAAPYLTRRESLPNTAGILMFPAMLFGPSLAGIILTRIVDGKIGLRDLFSRLSPRRVPVRWYLALLLPPIFVLGILLGLKTFVSPLFAPNWFLMGVLFGIPAGLLEEIGWMGYAFPKTKSPGNAFIPSILLGLLWAVWHLPVTDFLGTATPHGAYWLEFFLAFTAAMTAMRVLICWIYANTGSVLMAQFMHVSSTGSLVIFSAPRVGAKQEALWYALYGVSLWLVVAVIVKIYGKGLARQTAKS